MHIYLRHISRQCPCFQCPQHSDMLISKLLILGVRPASPRLRYRGRPLATKHLEHVSRPYPRDDVHHVTQDIPDEIEQWKRGQWRAFFDAGVLVRSPRLRSGVSLIALAIT
jgi:hypothetical protein